MNNHPFIYNLLVTPRFRIWRHILLILGFTVLSVNQALFNCNELFSQFGYGLLVIAVILISYLICIYIALYVFIPKYLLTGEYIRFGMSIIALIIIFMSVHYGLNIVIIGNPDIPGTFFLFDILSTFSINLLCFAGIAVPVFLKYWLISNQRVNQLEKRHISSEVEQLKEQINPSFLFDILNSTSRLTKEEPQKASKMLMKLSELLRYQLYDCNRDKVVLSSEIAFLSNFLELEKSYSPYFEYTIVTAGNPSRFFIPPLLLFPFIQAAVKLPDKNNKSNVDVCISADKDEIRMEIEIRGNIEASQSGKELANAKERLSHLYRNNSSLSISMENKDSATINLRLIN